VIQKKRKNLSPPLGETREESGTLSRKASGTLSRLWKFKKGETEEKDAKKASGD
jgi:hypothetical protein